MLFVDDVSRVLSNHTNLEWLHSGTILLTRHGSHAYGTNTPSSDEDFKGVAIPPARYFHGYLDRFEQAEFKHQAHGIDMVIYDLRKFIKLAADCNPSIIEVLFTDPSDHLIETKLGQMLREAAPWFVSKKAKFTFSGYAVSQLKKIQAHYRWLKTPPKGKPSREEFGLPERTVIPADQLQAAQSMIRKQIEQWNVPIDELDDAARIAVQERFVEALALIETGYRAQVIVLLEKVHEALDQKWRDDFDRDYHWSHLNDVAARAMGVGLAIQTIQAMPGANLERIAGNLLGMDDNFLDLLDRERQYRGRMEEWRSYQTWLETRNPARQELEAKYGYDTKHGMHLVRLIRMGEEILEGKGVIVKRPDRDELLAIRGGAWSYEHLLSWAESKLGRLDELYRTSTAVPNAPDRKRIDDLCQRMIAESIGYKCSE